MPTYQYVCDTCGHNFEVFRKMTDDPITGCPQCGKNVRQVFSADFGLNFSGKGFYTTDAVKKVKPAQDSSVKNPESKPASSCGCSCGCSCSS